MHPNTIHGMIAQNKAELRAIEKGYLVSKPITECARYDMIIDDGVRRERVQVKYAGGHQHRSKGSCVADLRCKSGRHVRAPKSIFFLVPSDSMTLVKHLTFSLL